MVRALVIATLLAALGLPATADGSAWQVTSWTTDDALPQGVVYAIRQTADGYLWFTTLGGLVRYDGVEFTVFARGVTPGLRSNRFTTLAEGRDGTLWAGTEDGFVTRYRRGAFSTISIDGSLSPVIAIDAEGARPSVVTLAGQFHFDGSKFIRTRDVAVSRNFLYRTGPATVDDRGVTVYASSREPRLFPVEGLGGPVPRGLVTGDEGAVWIVDDAHRIFEVRDGVLRPVQHPALTEVVRTMQKTDGGVLRAMARTRDGAFWVAHSSRGIARVHGSAVEWITRADGLTSLDVCRIYEDREGTIWATTAGGGINALRRRAAHTYGAAEGMHPPIAYPLLTEGQELLVGSWGGGVYHFDRQRFAKTTDVEGWILALARGADGALWVSSHGMGVIRIRNGERRHFTRKDGLPSHTIRVVHRARDGAMWFGGNEGLARLGNDDRMVRHRLHAPQWNMIEAIAEDRDGSLLVGTRAGLARIRNGKTTVVADEKSGLSSGYVRALHVGGDGTIWIGTYDGGLNRLRNGRIAPITTRQGLFDNGVFAIVEDAGFFWMSSNRGIHRASVRELHAVADGEIQAVSSLALTRGDGLLSAECNGGAQPAAARTADGLLWFPTQQGIVAVNPKLVPVSAAPPPTHLTGVSVDGESRPPLDELRVSPGSRRVEFRFAAPTTRASRLIRYRYKLEGFDPRWNEVVGERVASYTQIPPGRYRFLVSASNADGAWTEKPASASVVVLPPFWQTWWFRTAAAAAAVLLLWLLYALRMRGVRKEQVAQAEFSRRLLMQQEDERKRVASELHDSLGQSLLIIKNRALLGIDQHATGAAREQLDEISTTASSAIDEVRRIAHNLRPAELDHLGLTRSLEVLVRRMSSSSPILFSGDLDPVDKLLPREAEVNVFRIVQEWLSNIARHSKATAAVVSLRREDHRLRLRIHDDGSGFGRDNANEARTGIGLRSIAERVQMLGGTYDIRSTAGEGTSMTVDLPLREGP
jgi:signal transduction histidine kinase/ligand-binding sensor domain-containing protein